MWAISSTIDRSSSLSRSSRSATRSRTSRGSAVAPSAIVHPSAVRTRPPASTRPRTSASTNSGVPPAPAASSSRASGRRTAQDAGHQGGHRLGVEGLERQLTSDPGSAYVGDELAQGLVATHALRPVGPDQEDGQSGEGREKVTEQRQRRGVSPVEIVDEHHHRSATSQPLDQAGHGFEQQRPFELRLLHRRRRGQVQLGPEPPEAGKVPDQRGPLEARQWRAVQTRRRQGAGHTPARSRPRECARRGRETPGGGRSRGLPRPAGSCPSPCAR